MVCSFLEERGMKRSRSVEAGSYVREFFKEDDISTTRIVLSFGRFSQFACFHLFSGEVKSDKPIRRGGFARGTIICFCWRKAL